MSRLRIDALERVEVREWERPRNGAALWHEDEYGKVERLTRRGDRPSQMLALVMCGTFLALVGFGLGVVHGRMSPLPVAPVAAIGARQ